MLKRFNVVSFTIGFSFDSKIVPGSSAKRLEWKFAAVKESVMEAIGIVLAVVAGALYLAALVYAAVRIIQTADLAWAEKIIWIAATIAFPLVGPIIWFALGPHPFGIRLPQNPRDPHITG